MTNEEAIQWLNLEIEIWEAEYEVVHPTEDALKVAIKALEKQIPKNAELEIEEGEYAIFLCPNCNGIFHNYIDKPHYCEHCGQAIDWSDTE